MESHSGPKLVNCKQILSLVIDQTGADPGFPRGRGAQPQRGANLLFGNFFFRKLNETEEN